jgi:hypothetical protein
MKKKYYIFIIALIAVASCSKEEPMSPSNSENDYGPQMIKGDVVVVLDDDDNDNSVFDDITDPEKEDKEKTNKNAKN